MPKTHCAAPELASLLDGSSAGELIPELARHGPQQLIELELAAFLGADWHERSEERLGYRNGSGPAPSPPSLGIWRCRSPNCAPAASCPRSSSPAAGSIRPCTQ